MRRQGIIPVIIGFIVGAGVVFYGAPAALAGHACPGGTDHVEFIRSAGGSFSPTTYTTEAFEVIPSFNGSWTGAPPYDLDIQVRVPGGQLLRHLNFKWWFRFIDPIKNAIDDEYWKGFATTSFTVRNGPRMLLVSLGRSIQAFGGQSWSFCMKQFGGKVKRKPAAEPSTLIQPQLAQFNSLGSNAQAMRVEVFHPNGQLVGDSGLLAGDRWQWSPLSAAGDRLPNGVYFYVLSVRGADGQWVRQLGKMVVNN